MRDSITANNVFVKACIVADWIIPAVNTSVIIVSAIGIGINAAIIYKDNILTADYVFSVVVSDFFDVVYIKNTSVFFRFTFVLSVLFCVVSFLLFYCSTLDFLIFLCYPKKYGWLNSDHCTRFNRIAVKITAKSLGKLLARSLFLYPRNSENWIKNILSLSFLRFSPPTFDVVQFGFSRFARWNIWFSSCKNFKLARLIKKSHFFINAFNV